MEVAGPQSSDLAEALRAASVGCHAPVQRVKLVLPVHRLMARTSAHVLRTVARAGWSRSLRCTWLVASFLVFALILLNTASLACLARLLYELFDWLWDSRRLRIWRVYLSFLVRAQGSSEFLKRLDVDAIFAMRIPCAESDVPVPIAPASADTYNHGGEREYSIREGDEYKRSRVLYCHIGRRRVCTCGPAPASADPCRGPWQRRSRWGSSSGMVAARETALDALSGLGESAPRQTPTDGGRAS